MLGPIVLDQSALVYLSWAGVLGIGVYLARTRPGLNLRSVGEQPSAADALGVKLPAWRYAYTLVGGALAGLAGATISHAVRARLVLTKTRPRAGQG